MNLKHGKIWLLTLALAGAIGLQARATTVTAALDPAQISMGDSAQLTVTVSGSQEQPTVPSIDGLDITAVGQSTQIEVINGSITANASNTYQVTPQREGTFTIPAIHAGNASSQPLTLTVGKGSSVPPAASQNLPPPATGPVVQPPLAATPESGQNTSEAQGRFGSIQVNMPKKEFYVGELVPVEIKAYVPDDIQASLSDLPQFTSDGFAMNSLSTKLQRSMENVNGRSYTVLTWHTALTAVKAGDYPFTLQMPLTVVVPQRMPQGNPDDMFNSFFNNAFAMGTRKNVTLQASAQTLKVLPLPEANRPANFSGAVGQFDIEASATPTNVNAGDPITLRLKVMGTGNFDRVSSDLLANDAHWKTYSPKSNFEPADSVGYQGVKTFEQPVIPNDASASAIPSVSFSFFNPETHQYVTRTAAPIAVTVNGSAANPASGPVSTPAVTSNPPPPAPASATPADDLRPNRIEPGAFAATLQPVYLNPWFIGGQSLPLLALLGGLAFIRRQKHVSDPRRMRATAIEQAIREQVAAMDEAMRHQHTDAFFVHARNALQQRLGQQWGMRPETITLSDVEARLGTDSEMVRPIFDMADQASYSDLHFEAADLAQWRQVVLNELSEKK